MTPETYRKNLETIRSNEPDAPEDFSYVNPYIMSCEHCGRDVAECDSYSSLKFFGLCLCIDCADLEAEKENQYFNEGEL